MKKLSLLTFLLLLISVLSFAQRQQKVGLVLSGGGARGLAHIGAIKALEDNNIKVLEIPTICQYRELLFAY